MTDTPALRPSPACTITSALPLARYSPAPWQVDTCSGCDMTYLRNPPAYDALQEDFAWEKTYADKKASSAGWTRFSPYARKLRNALDMCRNKTSSFRRWFNGGHVLDIEHETDAMGVLKGAHRALKPSGGVFVRVPNFGSLNRRVIGAEWCGFRYPDHVNYFTLATLTHAAHRAGFTTELINRIRLHIDDNISVLLRKTPMGVLT